MMRLRQLLGTVCSLCHGDASNLTGEFLARCPPTTTSSRRTASMITRVWARRGGSSNRGRRYVVDTTKPVHHLAEALADLRPGRRVRLSASAEIVTVSGLRASMWLILDDLVDRQSFRGTPLGASV